MDVKKIIAYLIICITIVFLVSCSSNGTDKKEKVNHVNVEAKTPCYTSVEEMEGESEIIVKVRRLDEAEPYIKKVNNIPTITSTYSKVEVEEIYKNNGKINDGDVITLLENEVFDKDNNEEMHIAGYSMLKPGCEYLLFLVSSSYDGVDYYVALGVNYGTISLDDDGRYKEKDEDGNSIMSQSVLDKYYKDLWQEAKEKYIK